MSTTRSLSRRYISLQDAAEQLDVEQRTLPALGEFGPVGRLRFGDRLIRLDADEVERMGEPIPTADR